MMGISRKTQKCVRPHRFGGRARVFNPIAKTHFNFEWARRDQAEAALWRWVPHTPGCIGAIPYLQLYLRVRDLVIDYAQGDLNSCVVAITCCTPA